MGKKILILFSILVFVLLAAGIFILSFYSLKLKKQISLLNEQMAYQKCFPPLEEMLRQGWKGNLGNSVVFSSVHNFKKGLPDDLPVDFSLFPGVESDKVFSFPFPYEASWGVRKGVVFGSSAKESEIITFYSELFQSKGWTIFPRVEDTRLGFWRIDFSKENQLTSLFIHKAIPYSLPRGLDLEGESIIFFRYL